MEGLRDSKLLSAAQRERLAADIRCYAIAWAVGAADVTEIDTLNILQASLLAMRRAVEALSIAPREALIDGNRCPLLTCKSRAIVGGDRDVPAISAASILAKTTRDTILIELDRIYPAYGFAQHKGLRDARTPGGARSARPVSGAPAVVRACDAAVPPVLTASEGSLAVDRQYRAFPGVRGNGMTSRTLARPVTYATVRSKPSPNPACGTVP